MLTPGPFYQLSIEPLLCFVSQGTGSVNTSRKNKLFSFWPFPFYSGFLSLEIGFSEFVFGLIKPQDYVIKIPWFVYFVSQ